MPYITRKNKEMLAAGCPIETAGNLNYMITMLLKRYWTNSNRRYQDINDIMGALEGAKQEFYRRIAIDYEKKKIEENGDVY